jgi:hypothetical protein
VRDAVGAAILAAVCAAGLATIEHVPGHDVLKAHSPGQWLAAAATGLSWPQVHWPAAFLVLQLPMVVLVAGCVRARRMGREESVLVCLALWTWLQTAAIAYGRANFGLASSPRYTDLYAVGAFANVLALAVLLRPGPRVGAWGALAAVWAVLFSCGLWARNSEAVGFYLGDYQRMRGVQAQSVRSYLETGDMGRLLKAKPGELPYPRAEVLGPILDAPGIRAILPEGIRPAIALAPDSGTSGFEVAAPPGMEAGPGRTWVARRGPAHFVSQPLPLDTLPYLHVALAGSPDLDASALSLEAEDGRKPVPRFPLEGPRWHGVDVAVPDSAGTRLVVDIPPGEHWFALREPVELGRGSWLNNWLLRRSRALLAAAGVLFSALWIALLLLDMRTRPPRSAGA